MKELNVSAAIIKHKTAVLATKRGYGPYKGKWEFPGGKIEPGETPKQALVREIREELSVEITVGELIGIVEYDYPEFHLQMYCFLCEMNGESLVLTEHEAAKWLTRENIDEVDWLPADRAVLPRIKELWEENAGIQVECRYGYDTSLEKLIKSNMYNLQNAMCHKADTKRRKD